MSKYSELTAAYFEARERYWATYREHYDFAKRLVDDELRTRFEIPKGRFHYIPATSSDSEEQEESIQAEWRRIVVGFDRAQEASDRVLEEHAPALKWLADK